MCGTEQPDVIGRVLTAGALSVELNNGNLRYLRIGGVEVLRALSFLVRDENWGTLAPSLADLEIDQRADSFSVRYRARCERDDRVLDIKATLEGRRDGSVEFIGVATPATDFVTCRTGFVVLHPLKGVAGKPLEVEHIDGTVERSTFPERIDPLQPFLDIRQLAHEALPGLKAVVRMEGDTFEMEDQRNWTDASFKTYVRPLARPWPYVLKSGEKVRQSVSLTFEGTVPARSSSVDQDVVEIALGQVMRGRLPRVGLGMPADEIDASTDVLDLLVLVAPKLLICAFDRRAGHGRKELDGYRLLCERTGALCELEVVVESVDGFVAELTELAGLVREAGLTLDALAVCPAGDLKGVLPGSERPPAPPLAELYEAARRAFPGVRLGGGMFTFFTELNRKRPPVERLDFVHNVTCPNVHAADDRSVMETHEALAYQVATARSFIGETPYRIGPSAIGIRENPYGSSVAPNPDAERISLAKDDPRQRGLFGAAWALGYVASLAPLGLEAITFGAPTGPLGIIATRNPRGGAAHRPPHGAVFPACHVVAGLTRGAGAALVAATSSDDARVRCLAYRTEGGTLLWTANMTSREQIVQVSGAGAQAIGIVLDESTFHEATTAPAAFLESPRPIDVSRILLRAYAVALICIDDR
ncbi:MAG: hypothetical protein ABIV63_13795 [Caldimonas sp.]